MSFENNDSHKVAQNKSYDDKETKYKLVSDIPNREPPNFRRKRLTKQILLLILISVGHAPLGAAFVWPNVLATQITRDNSTIFDTQIYLADWQLDMTASMMSAGSMPGFLLAGWLVGCIGRRWSLFVSSIPTIIGSALVTFSCNGNMLLIGRFLDGVTFGMIGVAMRTYVAELSDSDIRGIGATIMNLLMQLGGIFLLSLGIVFPWYYTSMFTGGVMLVFCLLIVPFLPESPTYLAINNKDAEAYVTLSRLRGPYTDHNAEIANLKKVNQTGGDKAVGFRGLCETQILKQLLILFGLFLVSNFSGVQVLKANTARMLQASGFDLDNIVCTIIVTTLLFLGNSIMMLLIDRIGRRSCIIASFCILAVAYYSLGSYSIIIENIRPVDIPSNTTTPIENNLNDPPTGSFSWIPLLCLVIAAFGQGIGVAPLPFIMAPEYFPTRIRSQAMSVCTMVGALQSFATLQLFSPMQKALTSGGMYLVFAVSATFGIPYAIYFVKETRGKTIG